MLHVLYLYLSEVEVKLYTYYFYTFSLICPFDRSAFPSRRLTHSEFSAAVGS